MRAFIQAHATHLKHLANIYWPIPTCCGCVQSACSNATLPLRLGLLVSRTDATAVSHTTLIEKALERAGLRHANVSDFFLSPNSKLFAMIITPSPLSDCHTNILISSVRSILSL